MAFIFFVVGSDFRLSKDNFQSPVDNPSVRETGYLWMAQKKIFKGESPDNGIMNREGLLHKYSAELVTMDVSNENHLSKALLTQEG